MRELTQSEQNKLQEHALWLRNDEEGARADFALAHLEGAHLEGAHLEWANLDFSAWPLWCGSVGVKVDLNIVRQLAAHFCVLDCAEPEYQNAKAALLPLARQFNRAQEMGLK